MTNHTDPGTDPPQRAQPATMAAMTEYSRRMDQTHGNEVAFEAFAVADFDTNRSRQNRTKSR